MAQNCNLLNSCLDKNVPKLASWVLSHPHPTLCQAVNFSELQRQIQAPPLANPTQSSRWSGGGITHSWLGKRAASSQRVFCSVLLLICGHVWNLTVLLVSLLFSYFVFLTRLFLPEQPSSYSIQDPTPEECSAPAGFRRKGCQTLPEMPPQPMQRVGRAWLPTNSTSVIGTEETQPSADGQGKVLIKSLPGHIYSSIRVGIRGPCPPL